MSGVGDHTFVTNARLTDMTHADPDSLHHLHTLCSDNRALIADQGEVCCFHCLVFFDPETIHATVDDGRTVLCPHCGIDSVIPSTGVDVQTLKAMNEMYFAVPPSDVAPDSPTRRT